MFYWKCFYFRSKFAQQKKIKMDYKKVVIDVASNFCSSTKQKIKDANKAKSNLADPHSRTVVSYPVHLEIFKLAFGQHFSPGEKAYDSKHGCEYKIHTLDRLIEVIGGENLVKCKPDGDKMLICPWGVVRSTSGDKFQEILTSSGLLLQPGNLVLPLSNAAGGGLKIFIPTLPDDDDEIPVGYCENNLIDVIPSLDLEVVPLVFTAHNVTIEGGLYHFSIKPKGLILPKDVICVSGKRYLVETSRADIFKPGYDFVSISPKVKFSNFNKKRPMKYGRMPKIIGKIDEISNDNVSIMDPVRFQVKNVNKQKHGVLNIMFKNAIFNEAGYLTHDTSVPIGDV